MYQYLNEQHPLYTYMNNIDFFILTWNGEWPQTIHTLQALPAVNTQPRVHPAIPSAEELAAQMVLNAEDLVQALENGIVHHEADRPALLPLQEAVNAIIATSQKVARLLKTLPADEWEESLVPFLVQDKQLHCKPLGTLCWELLLDIVHARGQLATYYREHTANAVTFYKSSTDITAALLLNNNN